MALRTTLARLAQPLRAQSAAFSAIPTPRPKYTERQEKLGRPMSPHVTTYAFPAVAISSITQRVTGVLLSVGVGGVAAFPLTYHYAGALRHTLWDRKPETMLNNKDAEKSSYLVMGGSTIVAAGLAAMSW
jgi:succinate dehydrogenase (ubiquinone) cytochrome b560 subunit